MHIILLIVLLKALCERISPAYFAVMPLSSLSKALHLFSTLIVYTHQSVTTYVSCVPSSASELNAGK
jgi:hypothetical protein